jgi:hypothetical protein
MPRRYESSLLIKHWEIGLQFKSIKRKTRGESTYERWFEEKRLKP